MSSLGSAVSHEPPKRHPTYADIEALPDHVVGEILDGELVVSPRPAPAHTLAASKLGTALGAAFMEGIGGPGGWWILDEPELSLAADPRFDPVVPDLAGWRLETLSALPDTAQFKVTPDWVCEVLSPSTALHDRVKKLPYYGRAGVGHVWLVDPLLKTVEVFSRTEAGGWTLHAATHDDRARLPPFDAVEIEVGRLWAGPVQPPPS